MRRIRKAEKRRARRERATRLARGMSDKITPSLLQRATVAATTSDADADSHMSTQATDLFSADDTRFMQRALELAERGLYTTTPNPRVGCVIVRNGEVIAEGWHERAGGPHAEAHALAQARAAGVDVAGACVYVTLEPCSHHGRTPPCADALVAAGVAEVVVACGDSNPVVAGNGLARLQAAGIRTRQGLLEAQARELNIGFFSRMQRGLPWVRMKAAISLDGFVALPSGESQWITGEAARADGHHWRARACAILTGIGTVKADNPQMTVRGVPTARQPVRVIVDSALEIDLSARVLDGGALIAHAVDGLEPRSPGIDIRHAPTALQLKADALRERGVELLYVPQGETVASVSEHSTEAAGSKRETSAHPPESQTAAVARKKVDLPALMRLLASRGMNEIHVEAGGKLNGSLIREGCVDELLLYQAPRLLGQGQPFAALPAANGLDATWNWKRHSIETLGEDVRVVLRSRD